MITDQQLIIMTQQYTTALDGEYVCHDAYRIINEQVTSGRPWSKCRDCGNPYPLDGNGVTVEFCSSVCETTYLQYLNSVGDF